MKILKAIVRIPTDRVEDCLKIQRLLLEKKYLVELSDIYLAWDNMSSDRCAGWLIIQEEYIDILLEQYLQ